MSFGLQIQDKGKMEQSLDIHSLYAMYHRGDVEEALTICARLLLHKENKENIFLLDVYSLLLFKKKEFDTALGIAGKLRELCLENGNNWLAAYQSIKQGRIFFDSERYKMAEGYFVTARQELELCGDKWGEAWCRFLWGGAAVRLQKYQQALELYNGAFDAFTHYGDDDNQGNCCSNIAAVYQLTGEQVKALQYLNKAIALKERYTRSIEYSVSGGYGKILQTFDGYIRLPLKRDRSLGNAYINYAVAMDSLGEHDKALEYCQKALEVQKRSNDMFGLAGTYNTIGMTAMNASQFDTAEYYFNEGRKKIGEQGYIYIRALLTMNLARVYVSRQQYDTAREYFLTALEMFRGIEDNPNVAYAYAMLAKLNLELDRRDVAQQYLDKGIAIAKELALVSELVDMQITLAKVLMKSGTTRVKELLNQTLLIADEYGMKKRQYEIHKELASLYKLDGSTTLALYHFERYHNLKEELYTEDRDKKLRNMQILHEVEQHRQKALEAENAIRTLRTELEKKTRELTAFALRITEKQELLDTMHNGLRGIIEADSEEKNEIARELLRIVESANTSQRDWREFSRHFADLHQHFMENMSRLFPDLSPTELKVCALLRLNMSTKQIASIMHVSDRAVENHRLRLRKKLGLHRDDNLTKRLLEI